MKSRAGTWAFVGVVLLLLGRPGIAQKPSVTVDSLAFLVGRWVGEGTNEGAAGSGYATFELSLKGKTLLRKNHAEYPATKDRPASTHEDLMIVYADTAAGQLRAFYTDTEGNTINYIVTLTADGKTVTFESDPHTVGPRFRLKYVRIQPDRMNLTFEMAPADKPDQFVKFLEGSIRKTAGG